MSHAPHLSPRPRAPIIPVALLVLLSLLVLPGSAANLSTPVPVSPVNNQVFYHYPLITFWTWDPVSGADQYTCEVQMQSGGTWVPYLNETVRETYYEHEFIGYKTGRWRVTARDTTGKYSPSEPSSWRTFRYSQAYLQLGVPRPISPADGTPLYTTGKKILVTWRPVAGAARYRLEVQQYSVSTGNWQPWRTAVTGDGITSYMEFYFSDVHEKGRWRVTALAPDGSIWRDSLPSPWRTFTSDSPL